MKIQFVEAPLHADGYCSKCGARTIAYLVPGTGRKCEKHENCTRYETVDNCFCQQCGDEKLYACGSLKADYSEIMKKEEVITND